MVSSAELTYRPSQLSPGLHPAFLDDRARLGRGQEFDQRPGRIRRRRCRMQAGGELREVLDVGRQRPEVVDPLRVEKFADLLESEIDLAPCHDLSNLNAGWSVRYFVLDLIGNAHPLEQLGNI